MKKLGLFIVGSLGAVVLAVVLAIVVVLAVGAKMVLAVLVLLL